MTKKMFFPILACIIALSGCDCSKYDEELYEIDKRLDEIEGSTITSIAEQIAAINTSLADLQRVDAALQTLIDDLEAETADLQRQLDDNAAADAATKQALENEIAGIKTLIEALQAKDAELDRKIADLKAYIDSEIFAAEDWANATFATLTQYEEVQTEIAAIKALIEQYKTDITAEYTVAIENAIADSETSMKTWVNELLADGYYDIATIDAKLATLETKLTDADAELRKQIEDQQVALEQAKTELTTACEEAIADAIATNNGIINAAIAATVQDAQTALQNQIDAIETQIAGIESRLSALETNFANRIQSLTYIPKYTDGKATMTYDEATGKSEAELEFFVTPKNVISNIEISHIAVKATYTVSRAASLTDLTVTGLSKDTANGTITVKFSGENLSQDFFNGTADMAIFLIISDGNSEFVSDYVPLTMEQAYTYDQTSNTYTVYTAKGLYAWNEALQNDLTTNLVLAADITLPNRDLTTGEEITVTDGKPGGSNWNPYGYYDRNVADYTMYNGTIDGGGHTISGMRINMDDRTGFVKTLGGNGSIKNLLIDDVVIYSTDTDVAVFAGTNFGIIENCHVKGEASSIYGSYNVGGIAGNMSNKPGNAQIVACSNMAAITTANVYSTCGGIVASIYDMGYSNNLNVIGCWTKDTNESDGTKDGIGRNNGAFISGVFSVADATAAGSKIVEMNQALTDNGYSYQWKALPGSWPVVE